MQLIGREVLGRYRGSILGLAWSFFNPLLMLTIYTFVFSVVFKARWGNDQGQSHAEFALILFSGLIMHSMLSECAMRAPMLVLSNANYVKKVVFPLEVLCWVNLGSALFHTAISLTVLMLATLAVNHTVPWTVLLMPLILIPFALGVLGVSWALAALGVYIRDVGQIMGMLMTILMFLTPIFYPVTALPESFQVLVYLNPLTWVVEQARNVMIFGTAPAWGTLLQSLVVASGLAWFGFWIFQRLRKGFADVL
nr:ABC transporter permease [uncultured Cupriavidus sp.]